MNTVERILDLAAQKGIKQSYLNQSIGGYRGKLTDWKNKKSSPTAQELAIIAKVLGTTEAYLRGETENPAPSGPMELSPPILAIVKDLQGLSEEALQEVHRFVVFQKTRKI